MGITKHDVKHRLNLGEVDADELLELLFHHVGDCEALDDRRLVLPRPASGPALLVLHFTASGRLADVEPGDALTTQQLDEMEELVRRQLVTPPLPRVVRKVLFSTQPNDAYWRFEDRLVLRPLPEGNPTTPWPATTHPLIFECAYLGPEDTKLCLSRGARIAEGWMSILGLVVEHLVLPTPGPVRGLWATAAFQRPGQSGHPSSEWVHNHFWPDDWGGAPNRLCEQGKLGGIPVTDQHTGFARCESSLHLPTCLPHCLRAFDDLDVIDRRSFLRAAHWFHHAAHVRELSASAAYTAAVQSIEVLVDGQGESTTSAFRAFVDLYAPATNDAMYRMHQSLYRIRSQISHGVRLFVSDLEIHGMPSPQRWHEEQLLDHATAVYRAAILNWLLSRTATSTRGRTWSHTDSN
ncbi:hypothetical protein ACFRAI_43215 [Streptomyces sp. NPDC056637]|uniref:hypothetical protein n=1 Tax=unclassified Streptomyces TaxID=2593676 RepID=UPI003698F13D